MAKKNVFVKGAYLYTLDKELTEEEFIARAGGIEKLNQLREFPFVSLVLDIPEASVLIGHTNARTINLSMTGHGNKLYQTMEWRK